MSGPWADTLPAEGSASHRTGVPEVQAPRALDLAERPWGTIAAMQAAAIRPAVALRATA